MSVIDWQIDRFDGAMIRLTNESCSLVLQAQPGGAYDFEEYDENGEHTLIWDGDTVRLTVTKYEEDGNVKMEFSQRNNGFPIALFNRLHPALFDEFLAYSQNEGDQPEEAPLEEVKIPAGQTDVISMAEIEDGTRMVDFQGERTRHHYYTEQTYNSLNPKNNPFTREPIDPNTITRYTAKLDATLPVQAAGRRRKTRRSNVKSRSRQASQSSGLRSSKA